LVGVVSLGRVVKPIYRLVLNTGDYPVPHLLDSFRAIKVVNSSPMQLLNRLKPRQACDLTID
jgi:hypothetical protein